MRHFSIRPAGDSAVLVDWGNRIDPLINRQVHAFARRMREEMPALIEVVPGYSNVLVSYNATTLSYEEVAGIIRRVASSCTSNDSEVRRYTLPVVYGGEYAPDLEDVARHHSLTPDEVVKRHSSRDYPIYCIGFSPGFPFLGGLDDSLATPRLDTPRPRVPAGSVGIGGSQTGVYPTSTPGGWRLIGRTPVVLFDPARIPPVAYRPGDLIRFQPIDVGDFEPLRTMGVMPHGESVT